MAPRGYPSYILPLTLSGGVFLECSYTPPLDYLAQSLLRRKQAYVPTLRCMQNCSIEEVARIIEERDKITLIPSGTYVLNKLGLSTQIPMNVVYITNGSSRTIKLGKGRGIQLKRSNDMKDK